MMKIPAVMRDGRVEIEHDRDDDEVRIKYSSIGSLCLDYLKRDKKESYEDFVLRVLRYVTYLKL